MRAPVRTVIAAAALAASSGSGSWTAPWLATLEASTSQVLAVMAATAWGTAALFGAVPKSFFPVEDTGQIQVSTEAAQDISFSAMVEKQRQVAAKQRFAAIFVVPGIANVL